MRKTLRTTAANIRKAATATRSRIRATIAAAALLAGVSAAAAGDLACEREMARASAESGVPLNVLYSVGLTETGNRGELGAYDMNVDGRAVHSITLSEALARFAVAKAHGARFIDIGCMQINERFHGMRFPSPAAMFDPHRNVDYAAAFLKGLKAEQGSWTLAVARYNAGPNNPAAQHTYVCAVIRNLVASGFGRWTANARALCPQTAAR